MESVPYRNTKLLVKTIPKGTLLFRLAVNPDNDVKGIPIDNGKRCITPNFSVYFFPNPFAGELAFEKYLYMVDDKVYIYITTRDIKVFNLTKPSKYSRRDKSRKNNFIKRCSTIRKGCLPRPQNAYDACLSETIIKKYPQIVGMFDLPFGDNKNIKRNIKLPKNKDIKKYFYFTEDQYDSGIPELVLHPLVNRSSADIISDENVEHDTNYKLLKIIERKDKKLLIDFMDNHTVYNPDTFYYNYKE